MLLAYLKREVMVTEGKVTDGKMCRCMIPIAGAAFCIQMINYDLRMEGTCHSSALHVLGEDK